MKKFLAVAVLFVLSLSFLQAQQTSFGVKVGYNSAWVHRDRDNYDSKSGIHAGFLAHIHVSEHFAVQPEVMWSMQGGEGVDPQSKLKLNYINVPVLAQYMFSNGFRIETGPQIGFLVSADQKFASTEVDVSQYYSSTDFSWAFGLGYLFKSGFGVDARYNMGINNISEEGNNEARNRVLQAGFFYQFGGKKKVKTTENK